MRALIFRYNCRTEPLQLDTLPCQGRDRGFDGDQSREYKLPDTHFAVAIPAILVRPSQHQPHLPPTHWPEIAERARYKSLRDLATEYGVSHETIRAIVRRVVGHQPVGLIS